MDTATLVDEQIDEGTRLIDHLSGSGFEVVVAFWVLTSEDEIWFLYIATRVVDDEGLAKAYRKLYSQLPACNLRWISRSDIKLVAPGNVIALDAKKYQSNRLPTRHGGRKLGNLIIDEAYIYPKRPQ
jgi:hypothetical protein